MAYGVDDDLPVLARAVLVQVYRQLLTLPARVPRVVRGGLREDGRNGVVVV